MKPVRPAKIIQQFAAPGQFPTRADEHGPAGHQAGVDFGSRWPFTIDNRIVRSVLDGEVMISERNEATGHWIGIYSPDQNLFSTYWHLETRLVRKGEIVMAYEPIGRVGRHEVTGVPHLHFQLNRGLAYDYAGHVDPEEAFSVWDRGAAAQRYRDRLRSRA